MKSPQVKTSPVRIGIIGTGGMAQTHAANFAKIKGCRVVAACDVDAARANEFCEKYSIAGAFSSVGEMLAKASIDAVSIVTPDGFHAPLSIECLRAGKHVLCEKPLALNHQEAKAMVAAAKRAGRVHMVNFSYRDWPCIQAVAQAVARGDIGEIRHVEASYLQAWLVSKVWGDWRKKPAWLWRLSTKHGSKGVLGDIGVHILDFATFPAGPLKSVFCQLRTFPKAPGERIGEYDLDANDSAVISVEFANGALGTIHTSRWVGGHANRLALMLAGTKGSIRIDSELGVDTYRVCRGADLATCTWKDVHCKPVVSNYQRFIRAIRTGTPEQPDFARGAEIQKLLDACVESDLAGKPVHVVAKSVR